MEIPILMKALIVGLSIAVPVGPIGILCIKRTMQNGILSGFASGFGAATADCIYAAIAAFGLTAISQFLIGHQFYIRIIGCSFLIFLGFKTFFSKYIEKEVGNVHINLIHDYISTMLLTITNPMTIFAFLAIFSSLGLDFRHDSTSGMIIVLLGIFSGSMLWWTSLSFGINTIKHKLTPNIINIINKISACIIISFACYIIYECII